MKQRISFFLIFAGFFLSHFMGILNKAEAQNIGINSSGAIPDPSAGLDIDFSDKGFLMPRINLASLSDAATIANPAAGLIVFNTNVALSGGTGIYFNAGTSSNPLWKKFNSTSPGGTSAPINPWNLCLAQYNSVGDATSDFGGLTYIDPITGASCTDFAAIFCTPTNWQNGAGREVLGGIVPIAGVTYHIRTDIYQEINTAHLQTSGCGSGAFKHGAFFTGFGDAGNSPKFRDTQDVTTGRNFYGFQYDANDNTIWAYFNDGTGNPLRTNTGFSVSTAGNRHTYEVIIYGLDSVGYYIDGSYITSFTQAVPNNGVTAIFLGMGNQKSGTSGNKATLYSCSLWKE